MKANAKKSDISRKQILARSIPAFFLHYLILLAIILVFMIYYDPRDWMTYVQKNLNVLFYMIVCIFLLFIAIYGYYFSERRETLVSFKKITAIFFLLDVCVMASCFLGQAIHIYARPVALIALLAMALFSKREAILWNFMFAILIFIIDTYTNYDPAESAIGMYSENSMYSSLIVAVSSGMIAIFIAAKIKTRVSIVLLGIPITLPILAVILLLEMGQNGFFFEDLLVLAGYGFIGGISSTVFFLALLPVFESMFNILTVFRVRELTSPDAKLMAKLKAEAPGTFNHSMVVAQIVEMCAASLNENVELARAAALYHDMGKLSKPEYFTENQNGYNVHDELAPELSADIIRAHAREGYELILAHHLPQIFADVAVQHHGTLPIKYFYYKAKRMTDGEINIEDFSYSGPKPTTKIAAIVMIADAAEAASRTLVDRSIANVERVVREIIEERIDLDQFSDCDITMRELDVIRKTIVFSLTGVYHHRITYPPIKFGREDRKESKKQS